MIHKERKYDHCSGLEYVWTGDYYVPDTAIPEDIKKIGGFGLIRRRYLMQNDKEAYIRLYKEKKMEDHLIAINKRATSLYEVTFERVLHEICPETCEPIENNNAISIDIEDRRLIRDIARHIVEEEIICVPYSDEWETW